MSEEIKYVCDEKTCKVVSTMNKDAYLKTKFHWCEEHSKRSRIQRKVQAERVSFPCKVCGTYCTKYKTEYDLSKTHCCSKKCLRDSTILERLSFICDSEGCNRKIERRITVALKSKKHYCSHSCRSKNNTGKRSHYHYTPQDKLAVKREKQEAFKDKWKEMIWNTK